MDAVKIAVNYRMRPPRPGQAAPKHSSQQIYALVKACTFRLLGSGSTHPPAGC